MVRSHVCSGSTTGESNLVATYYHPRVSSTVYVHVMTDVIALAGMGPYGPCKRKISHC
jgi:hypothetical protein